MRCNKKLYSNYYESNNRILYIYIIFFLVKIVVIVEKLSSYSLMVRIGFCVHRLLKILFVTYMWNKEHHFFFIQNTSENSHFFRITRQFTKVLIQKMKERRGHAILICVH